MSQKFRSRGLTAAFSIAAALGLAGVLLTGCQDGSSAGEAVSAPAPPPQAAQSAQAAPQEGQSAPVTQTERPEGPSPVKEPPAEDPPAEEPVPETPPEPAYDFTQPVPESEPAQLEYFDDAAFVGDSRTDGFLIYSGIGRGKNLTSNGLSIFRLDEKKALTIGGVKYTLLEALALERYGKVYLSLGINELGVYNDKGFYESYCQAIDEIRAIQPDAVIYIQGLIPLNEEEIAQSTGRTYLTNEHLRVYNDLMRTAAQEKQVAFLDLYTAFADENGGLPAGASRDGVHLNKDYCKQWLSYLQTHTVDFETLYPDGVPEPQGSEEGTQGPGGAEEPQEGTGGAAEPPEGAEDVAGLTDEGSEP